MEEIKVSYCEKCKVTSTELNACPKCKGKVEIKKITFTE
jgi:predicted RNA-binding protein with PUA domain